MITIPLAALLFGVSVSDSAQVQEFLREMITSLPGLATECVAKEGRIERPPRKEANQLAAEKWFAPPITLDSARGWWVTRPTQYRMWAVCEGNLLQRLLTGLRSAVESGRSISAIEPLLVAMTDTNRISETRYIAARVRSDSSAARLVAVATATGDPHRYDEAIASDGIYNFRSVRGTALALLGRVYLAQGRLSEARQVAAEAERLSPWADPLLLTQIALREGDTTTAVHRLAFCRVAVFGCRSSASRDSATARQLDMLYSAMNKGTLDGLDTILKNTLLDPALRFPVLIAPWRPATRNPKSRERVALLQYATWVQCGNCARHDLGAEALTRRFEGQLVVLAYHYTLPLTVPGWRDYGVSNIGGTIRHLLHVGPANFTEDLTKKRDCDWWIDGACLQPQYLSGGRVGALMAYDLTAPIVERRLDVPPAIDLTLRATLLGDTVFSEITTTRLSAEGGHENHPLKLQVVLTEDSLLIPGANSPIQNHVVRAIAGDSAIGFGLVLPAAVTHLSRVTFALQVLEQIFQRKVEQHRADPARPDAYDPTDWNEHVYHLDRNQLSIVAYAQDQVTGEILQATRLRIRP